MWGWGEGEGEVVASEGKKTDMLDCCRPLAVEVYEIEGKEAVLQGWKEPRCPQYRGCHGLKEPIVDWEKERQ